MKTLLALIGLATSCFLSGCAHDATSKTESKPTAAPTATGTVTNAGTAQLSYQWRRNPNATSATNH
jgi:uncharacterized lipoprotein YajG